ncbi:MAG: riboflavin synthase subunit alpha [Gammaproteobacteria bacterium]|jgi:riboflavin synthase|tara:strand:+ start:1927 stop:2520 length:594 start_codon:yes stop_codon:yes gene_type:complete
MFTGIVQSKSKKKKIIKKNFGAELSVDVENGFTNNLKKGDSIAVNGVCLTVCSFTKKNIKFEIIHESLRLTNLIKNSSMPLNLERSLKIGDEIGGHLVSGHIHGMGKVEEFKKGKEKILTISKPAAIKEYIFKKGYVAINGISLTVSSSSKKNFSVSLIPETIERTNLADIKKGDYLNIEADQQTIAIVETVKNIKK